MCMRCGAEQHLVDKGCLLGCTLPSSPTQPFGFRPVRQPQAHQSPPTGLRRARTSAHRVLSHSYSRARSVPMPYWWRRPSKCPSPQSRPRDVFGDEPSPHLVHAVDVTGTGLRPAISADLLRVLVDRVDQLCTVAQYDRKAADDGKVALVGTRLVVDDCLADEALGFTARSVRQLGLALYVVGCRRPSRPF